MFKNPYNKGYFFSDHTTCTTKIIKQYHAALLQMGVLGTTSRMSLIDRHFNLIKTEASASVQLLIHYGDGFINESPSSFLIENM